MRLQPSSPNAPFLTSTPFRLVAPLLLLLLFTTTALTGCGGGLQGSGPQVTAMPATQAVLAGQPATFSVAVSGTAPFTYQWQRNGGPIAGATASTYTLPATAWSDNGSTFAVTVENRDGSLKTPAVTLTVNAPPTLMVAPASQTITAGQAAVLSMQATGTQPIAVQWFRNGTPIAGATAATFTSAAMAGSDSGALYNATVSNAYGVLTTPMATVTVNAPPSVVNPPFPQTANAGQTATFSIGVTGTAPMSYQWSRNGQMLPGATTSSYTTPVLAATDSGAAYTVAISNLVGSINSSAAVLTVNTPPTVASAPVSQTVIAPAAATFSVAPTGTGPFTYQWARNGNPIARAIASTYTLAPTSLTDDASNFAVSITNAAGTVTSSPAILTVQATPSITAQPVAAKVNTGQTATFSVAATGTAPFTYQWMRNGSSLPGATSPTYTTPTLQATDSGTLYAVLVTNVAGSATSLPAALTVDTPPTLTLQPVSQTVTAPGAVSFSVAATGTGPFTYQWSRNGSPIAGATAAIYTLPITASTDNAAAFTATVTAAAGAVSSSPATLTVQSLPTLTSEPLSATVNAGQFASFSVTATGTAPFTYQWLRNNAPIPNANASSYITPVFEATDTTVTFTVSVSNAAGSVTSVPAIVTVNGPPTLSLQPVSQTVNPPAAATFSVAATGTGPFTYQWSRNGQPLAGATASTYTTPATSTSADNTALFTATVTNAAGSVTSVPATLTVNAAPGFTTQPASTTVPSGQPATFSVVATGTAPLSYQWFKNGTAIPGATGLAYTTPAPTVTDTATLYTVAVTNPVSTVTSAPATLNVGAPPAIAVQPQSTAVTLGQAALFSVNVTGTGPFTYQWFRDGIALPTVNSAATGNTYSTAATTATDTAAVFTVTVSNSMGSTPSAPATLTINTPPTITRQPFPQTANAGQSGIFSVAASGTAPFTYQWSKNGSAIAGATSSTYTTTAAVAADNAATYTVAVSNAAGTANSSAAVFTVVAPPTLSQQPVSLTLAAGQPATFAVAASNNSNAPNTSTTDGLIYQWFRNGKYIPGATTATYSLSTTTDTDNAATFYVIVADAAGSVTSSTATLTVNSTVTLLNQPQSQTVNTGQSAVFSVAVSGLAPYTFQWSRNGSPIAGATDSGYTTPTLTSTDNNATYTVAVTNPGGTITSSPATVTIDGTPTIADQPTPVTVNLGQPAVFEVTATGDNNLVYQWFRNGKYIPGATSRVYTSPATVAADDSSTYYVIVADQAGSVTSTSASLSVIQAPTISLQPVSQNVCSAANVILFVGAANATAYQWSLNNTLIAGATSSSYFIPSALNPNDAGTYSVIVANQAGSVTSQPATVNVGSAITANPVSRSVSATQTATFSVAATGKSAFTYQWFVVTPTAPATAIPGATSATYTTPALTTTANGNQYYATLTDACGTTLTTAQANLAVNNNPVPPTVISQPTGVQVAAGSTPTLTVVASGTPAPTYQWFTIAAGQVTGLPISGATAATYTLPATSTNAANDQDAYYVVVSNPQGQAVSQKATLAVDNGILMTLQPANQFTNPGAPASFSVAAASNASLTYQWYTAAPGSASFSAIPGATAATYTLPSTDPSLSGSVYYAAVTNGSTTPVQSASASLFVGPLNPIGDLCQSSWTAIGNATQQTNGGTCTYQLTDAVSNQQGEIVWPSLVATANLQLAFTVTTANASPSAADGFALVLGDASLGATTTSTGTNGTGVGAEGIPGLALAFNTAAATPTMGLTRGETALWENPWFNTDTAIPTLAAAGQTISHDYVLTLNNRQMTVTMDGNQVFSGAVNAPSAAYVYLTATTGNNYAQTTISNLSAVSTPIN